MLLNIFVCGLAATQTAMGVRRSTQVATGDDEGEEPPSPPPPSSSPSPSPSPLPSLSPSPLPSLSPSPSPLPSLSPTPSPSRTNSQKRKKVMLGEDSEEGELHHKEEGESRGDKRKLNNEKALRTVDEDEECEDDNRKGKKEKAEKVVEPETEPSVCEEVRQEDAKPIGDVVRVSGKDGSQIKHYHAFEYNGFHYDLEDPVLIVPMETTQKPYVAIVKDISRTHKGSMMVTGQWFYRPEETEIRTSANYSPHDSRELFYSFHRDEIPAESVMHKCVVNFIPLNKQIPSRKQQPGFLVQRVYDTEQMRLFMLSDKNYEDSKKHEIDLLVQKTFSRLRDLPDIESGDATTVQKDRLFKSKHIFRKKRILSLDVPVRDEKPGSSASQYFKILSDFNALTGKKHRDKWLQKLLQALHFMSNPGGSGEGDDKENRVSNGDVKFCWPDGVVPAVAAVEKAAYEALSFDFHKYIRKMLLLSYSFKNNVQLAERLLNGELKASQILSMSTKQLMSMSPKQLKEGMTAKEIASRQPDEQELTQCKPCGNTRSPTRDEDATLTMEEPSIATIVGTEPLTSSTRDDTEKLSHARTGEVEGTDDAHMPVPDSLKS